MNIHESCGLYLAAVSLFGSIQTSTCSQRTRALAVSAICFKPVLSCLCACVKKTEKQTCFLQERFPQIDFGKGLF